MAQKSGENGRIKKRLEAAPANGGASRARKAGANGGAAKPRVRRRKAPTEAEAVPATPGPAARRPAAKTAPKPRTAAKPRPAAKPEPAHKPKVTKATAQRRAAPPAVPAAAGPALTEEERIESAKYLPREMPKRVFEEERFLFPESYGVSRVRLLVKDPEWLFAHWDVDAKTVAGLRGDVGERAIALSRLTLRVFDPQSGGGNVMLLPPGARSWYVRADASRSRSYRAELGLTLPSGEFRRLAESNTVVTPRPGPSPERASRLVRYSQAPRGERGIEASFAEVRSGMTTGDPWRPEPALSDAGRALGGPDYPPAEEPKTSTRDKGGASDAFGPGGASDVHRR